MTSAELLPARPGPLLRVGLILPVSYEARYVLRLDGELDLFSVPMLRDSVAVLTSAKPWVPDRPLDLDLRGLAFIDITGLRALGEARDALRLLHTDAGTVQASRQLLRLLDHAHKIGWSPLPDLVA